MILESLAIQFDLVCGRQLLWGPPFHTQIDPALPDSFFAEFRFLHASGRTGSSSNPGEALVLRPHHRQLQCHHRDHEAGLRMVTWHGLGCFMSVFRCVCGASQLLQRGQPSFEARLHFQKWGKPRQKWLQLFPVQALRIPWPHPSQPGLCLRLCRSSLLGAERLPCCPKPLAGACRCVQDD